MIISELALTIDIDPVTSHLKLLSCNAGIYPKQDELLFAKKLYEIDQYFYWIAKEIAKQAFIAATSQALVSLTSNLPSDTGDKTTAPHPFNNKQLMKETNRYIALAGIHIFAEVVDWTSYYIVDYYRYNRLVDILQIQAKYATANKKC